MRSAISSQQKERLGALMDVALHRMSTDRAKDYSVLLASQRDDKSELRDDQRAGHRRHDVLPGQKEQGSSGHLTREQAAGYIAEARRVTATSAEYERTRREIAHVDRAREAGRDPHIQKAEVHDRNREKKDKDQAQEGKRQSDRDWYLAKRAADRARDRAGGRDR